MRFLSLTFLTHLNIHKDWSRNVFRKNVKFQNVTTSFFLIRFSSLCLKHGIDIPLPEPETLFLKRKNKSKPSNTKERHQQGTHDKESTTHYSIPTQNRFTTLSDSSTHPTDVNNVTSHIWWNTTAKRSPTRERRPTQTKSYYQDNSAKDSPKQSRQSPKDHSTTHPWRVHSPKGKTEKRHSPTAHKTNPDYKRTTPNHSFRRDATHSQGRQGQNFETSRQPQTPQQPLTPTKTRSTSKLGTPPPIQRDHHSIYTAMHQPRTDRTTQSDDIHIISPSPPHMEKRRSTNEMQHSSLQDKSKADSPLFNAPTQQHNSRPCSPLYDTATEQHNFPPRTTGSANNGSHTTTDHPKSRKVASTTPSHDHAQPTYPGIMNNDPTRTGYPRQTTNSQSSFPVFRPGRASTASHFALLETAYHAMMSTFQLLAVPHAQSNPTIHNMVTFNHHQIIDLVQSSLFMLTNLQ